MPSHHQPAGSLNSKETIVLSALRSARRPHTAYELIEQLRDQGIKAPPTIYRALNRLISLGHAHRLESLNAYVACRSDHCAARGNAAFAICDDCGVVDEIGASIVAPCIDDWAKTSRFAVGSVTLELHGKCRKCQEGGSGGDLNR